MIEAAARLGIIIPRFCYHPALGSVGACRVCAVSFIEGPVQGLQMSCMINVQDGMVISTIDDEAVDFRRHVIEWLMMNHPHDCPVCDEGGHCLLQDTTVAGGHGMRRYQGLKRTHEDQNLGPLLQHEMNRCIQCYRCSRYYQEFAGYKDLGVLGIGSRVYFGRSRPGTLESPFSGNLSDICPTGVYTDKPSRFFGRRWDFERAPSICLHCSLGCNLTVSARYRQVVRHEARRNDQVNGHFICDRGRFGYTYASSQDRPLMPRIKDAPASMSEAMSLVGRKLLQAVEENGPQSVAMIGSTRNSLETLAALTYSTRRLQAVGPAVEYSPSRARNLRAAIQCLNSQLAVSLGAVSVADAVVVIGADPLNEGPMLTLSLRQAHRQGGRITVIDPRPIEMKLEFDHLAVHPSELNQVARALIKQIDPQWTPVAMPDSEHEALESDALPADMDERLGRLARRLLASQRVVIVCGTEIVSVDVIALAAELAAVLRTAQTEAKLFYLLAGPNAYTAGVLMAEDIHVDAVVEQIESGRIKSLVVVENDLWRNYADRHRLTAAVERLDLLVLLDYVASPLLSKADVFIPTHTIYEAGGRWINQEGRLQMATAVLKGGEPIAITGGQDHPPRTMGNIIPGGHPLPAWQVVLQLAEGDQSTVDDHRGTLSKALKEIQTDLQFSEASEEGARIELGESKCNLPLPKAEAISKPAAQPAANLELLLVERVMGTEPMAAMSPTLSECESDPVAFVHPKDAQQLKIKDGDRVRIETDTGSLCLAVETTDRMAPGTMVVPRHHTLQWQVLGAFKLSMAFSRVTAEEKRIDE